ncbi:hypothetical protein D3H65_05565 [Paraflavitalea soli]|uniref:DUF748 domain-containing protein n=1 Tax=Paraflavitalea soli TaxID=2315862 RepID=A0A3B7MPI1_9BACT|nr:hypothetical protein [Paraflavitalea soli]AXY73475.1 hypothetical protein D3H65_05565 [Paraflavitalea soli]
MAVKPLVRKLLKVAGIVMGILLVLLVVAYLWFVHHAESIIRDIVRSKSNGTVELSLKNITYDFGQRRLNLREAVIYNTDSVRTKTAYRISVKRLSLQLHKLTPLILHRELVIDSILINNPDIRVMKSDTLEHRHGSLSHEIGDLYNSIHKALSLFSVGHFRIDNGRFSLANRARADWQPVTISNIYFRINHIKVGGNKVDSSAFHFSEDIVFNTDHQEITFPDGRYRMAFSNFRIHVKDRSIALDSCSIISTGNRQKKLALSLFFDKLKFSNLDFPALYATGVLKADSMYALNPLLNLNVTIDSARKQNGPPVHMDTLLKHLGINTQLKYIGVKNISTSVVTVQQGQSAEFNTKGDDFEMRDLVIDRTAKEPVSVGRFDMAIRGYTSLNKDSTYRFKFDSIRIINSSILLNNFSINSLAKANIIRHHQLPLFELDSLSWEELIFNRHIKAKQAVLYGPKIAYVKNTKADKDKKVSMYSVLRSLDKAMSLERIQVINGHISYVPNPDTRLLLQQVNLTVQTNQLLAARSTSMIGDAIDSLHFDKGSIKTKKLQASINNGSFTGHGTVLQAGEATIKDLSGNMTVNARDIRMAGLAFDDSSDHISIGTASWKEATVSINTPTARAAPEGRPPLSLTIRNIQGSKTHFSLKDPHSNLNTFVNKLTIASIRKDGSGKGALKVEGLAVEGTNLQYTGKDMVLHTGYYSLAGNTRSHINDVRFSHHTSHDTITAAIPRLQLVPDLEAILAGNLHAEEVILKEPILLVKLSAAGKAAEAASPGKQLPLMDIKQLIIEQPTLRLEQQQEEHSIHLAWNKGITPAHNQWVFNNIRHDGKTPITIDNASIQGTDVSFSQHADKLILLKPQSMELDLGLTRLATGKHPTIPWSTLIARFTLRNMQIDGIGKDSGRLSLKALTIEQLAIQGNQHHQEWLNNSPNLSLRDFSGDLTTTKNYFRWKQLSYHHRERLLSIDSFTYTPMVSRDAYIAAHPYQTDYIQLHTGRINIHRADLNKYFKDTLIHIGALAIYEPAISVYRDKRPPREPDVIRPLPVDMIKRLPFKIAVDSVLVHQGSVRYEEHSEKTNKSGVISISRLQALLANIKSRNIQATDSLKLLADAYMIDSIHVNLRLQESYTDSLAAFLMTTRVGPANLMMLNKVVEPLASVRIRSGQLDTLTLRAIGREYVSYGEMHMMYRKLNVEILQGGDVQKKSFVTKMITFIANTFVIKSRNNHKTGIIYFERLRDRSIFNYMIKMLLSGAGSSVGAKSNKKYLKHYRRELRKQGLPPIHL